MQVVAVLPNGFEYFFEAETSSYSRYTNIANDAIYKSGLKCKRSDRTSIKVNIFSLNIEKGKIVRKLKWSEHVSLPFERMNEQEYNEALVQAISALPLPFQKFVEEQAWCRGHAYGYEEVVNIADSLAYSLLRYVKEYDESLKQV